MPHDTRLTIIKTKDAKEYQFEKEAYDVFMKLLPDKEKSRVQHMSVLEMKSSDITSSLRQLAELRQEGLIDEEEFQEKKTELLSRI